MSLKVVHQKDTDDEKAAGKNGHHPERGGGGGSDWCPHIDQPVHDVEDEEGEREEHSGELVYSPCLLHPEVVPPELLLSLLRVLSADGGLHLHTGRLDWLQPTSLHRPQVALCR